VPEPYRSPDWALVPEKPAQGLNTTTTTTTNNNNNNNNNNKIIVSILNGHVSPKNDILGKMMLLYLHLQHEL
jgi:hypothetical protein